MTHKRFSIFPLFLGVPSHIIHSFQYFSTFDNMTAPGTHTFTSIDGLFNKKKKYCSHQKTENLNNFRTALVYVEL